MMNDQNNNANAMGAFLLGAIVGAGAALFFAPASGEETRRKVGETARRLGGNATDKFNEVKENVSSRVGDVKSAVGAGRDAYSRARTSTEPSSTSNAM